jgi:hypothetical protein
VYLKRTKSKYGPDGKALGAPAVHFAAKVAPAGNVAEWTADPKKAAACSEELCLKALDFYKTAPGTPGLIEAVDKTGAEPKPEPKKPAEAKAPEARPNPKPADPKPVN